jgi:hypothetical protein
VQEQHASFVLGIFDNRKGSAGRPNKGNASNEAVQRLRVAAGAGLGKNE